MYWAAERRGGKIIHADNARIHGDYRCPTCNAAVFLRSGRRRAEHFAHMPGQGKPDCEDYHNFGDLARVSPIATVPSQPKHVDPLALSIELDPEPQKRTLRKWRLRLTVPKAPDEHGQISIGLGRSDTRKISLTKLLIGPETYNVAPETVDFGASWVSPEVRREYREAVQHRIAGLDLHKGTMFAAARSKLKPRTYSLFWGESYYLVRHSDRAADLPASLACKPLARFEDWDCTLVALPHHPDNDIETWISEYCDLNIARSTRDWAVIYPAPFDLGDHGDLHIPSNDPVVLALKSSGVGPAGALTCSSGQSPVVTELDGTRQHFVALRGSDQKADRNIHVAWDNSYVATLTTRMYSAETAEIAVAVVCDGPDGKARADLHCTTGHALLCKVRGHRQSLIGLHAHPALRGHLRSRARDAAIWTEYPLEFAPKPGIPTHGALGDEPLRQLNSVLQDSSLDIELNFGPFGSFGAAAQPRPTATTADIEPPVPLDLRARIEWLARACNAYVDSHHRPIATLSNQALLAHFGHLRVPTKLLAHRRAINHRLRHLDIRGVHE